jgi:hypothetical protein
MPTPTQFRFRVKVYFLEEEPLTIEAEGPVQIQGDAVLIQTANGGHVGLNLRAVLRWEVVGSPIALAVGLQ